MTTTIIGNGSVPQLGLILTGNNGFVEWFHYDTSNTGAGTLSVVFYLNQNDTINP